MRLRKILTICLAAMAAISLATPLRAQGTDQTGTAAAETSVIVMDGSFFDESRDRDVPYRLYRPEAQSAPAPVVIFSHGLGGSREGTAYFGRNLAANGFIAFHIQHPGSDETIIEEAGPKQEDIDKALTKAVKKPRNALNRFRDVPFVIDMIAAINAQPGDMRGLFDLDRIGLAGHSFGARATLIAAGERVGPGLSFSFKEPRLKAAAVMSPNTPRKEVNYEKAYRDIDIPMLHITGTQDHGALPEHRMTAPEMRIVPYTKITTSDQYLLVLEDADHTTFSGRRLGTPGEKPEDDRHIAAVQAVTLAFFKATLLDDVAAMEWLKASFLGTLSPGDRFEFRLKAMSAARSDDAGAQ